MLANNEYSGQLLENIETHDAAAKRSGRNPEDVIPGGQITKKHEPDELREAIDAGATTLVRTGSGITEQI